MQSLAMGDVVVEDERCAWPGTSDADRSDPFRRSIPAKRWLAGNLSRYLLSTLALHRAPRRLRPLHALRSPSPAILDLLCAPGALFFPTRLRCGRCRRMRCPTAKIPLGHFGPKLTACQAAPREAKKPGSLYSPGPERRHQNFLRLLLSSHISSCNPPTPNSYRSLSP
jgi:hypothetical protein